MISIYTVHIWFDPVKSHSLVTFVLDKTIVLWSWNRCVFFYGSQWSCCGSKWPMWLKELCALQWWHWRGQSNGWSRRCHALLKTLWRGHVVTITVWRFLVKARPFLKGLIVGTCVVKPLIAEPLALFEVSTIRFTNWLVEKTGIIDVILSANKMSELHCFWLNNGGELFDGK